jgi:hypothetical protein
MSTQVQEVAATLKDLDPERAARLLRVMEKEEARTSKARDKAMENLRAKHSDWLTEEEITSLKRSCDSDLPGSTDGQKFGVEIKCRSGKSEECLGKIFKATSDLHQSRWCSKCASKEKKSGKLSDEEKEIVKLARDSGVSMQEILELLKNQD